MSVFLKDVKPCPYCGESDIRAYHIELKDMLDTWWNAFCHSCGAEVKYGNSLKDIRKKWDIRVI